MAMAFQLEAEHEMMMKAEEEALQMAVDEERYYESSSVDTPLLPLVEEPEWTMEQLQDQEQEEAGNMDAIEDHKACLIVKISEKETEIGDAITQVHTLTESLSHMREESVSRKRKLEEMLAEDKTCDHIISTTESERMDMDKRLNDKRSELDGLQNSVMEIARSAEESSKKRRRLATMIKAKHIDTQMAELARERDELLASIKEERWGLKV